MSSEVGAQRGAGHASGPGPGGGAGAGQVPNDELWDELQKKEHTILVLQKKLAHYRAWVSSVHGRVQQVNPQAIKNSRRLYVGGLPPDATEDNLRQFFTQLMSKTGALISPGPAVLSVKLTPEKGFAFVEFRSVEETSNAMAFDGVAFHDSYLKIRRPSNYDPSTAIMLGPMNPDPTMDTSTLDICRTLVEDSPHKLFVGGLPCEWAEEQVKELLLPFGHLKSFNLVQDKSTGKSKGYAFCEYADEATADLAIQSLNLRRVGNKALTVKRALEGGPGVGKPGSNSPGGTPPGTSSFLSKLTSGLGQPLTPTPSGSIGGACSSPLGPETPALQGALSALLQAQAQAQVTPQQALAQHQAAMNSMNMAALPLVMSRGGHAGRGGPMQGPADLAAAAEELAAAASVMHQQAAAAQQAQAQQDNAPSTGAPAGLMGLRPHTLWG